MAAIARQLAGSPHGGEFAKKSNTAPNAPLPVKQVLVRATAGDAQVVYEREGDRLRITVLVRDEARSSADGAHAWVEEGSVLTGTPAAADTDRMSSVASNQVSRLARAFDSGDDTHETVDAFLAELADRRDPFITRGTRRRHGEELEDAPWPDLDIAR